MRDSFWVKSSKRELLYAAFPILNMVVPQTSQTALVAGLPFFIVTGVTSFPSLFALHLTQYIMYKSPPLNSRLSIAPTATSKAF